MIVKLADMAINREFTQLFKVITLVKCVLTIRDLNWNQRFRDKKTNVNICHHMVTSSTQLQNRSFHVAQERERLRNVKNENCTCKASKTVVFPYQICIFDKEKQYFCTLCTCVLRFSTFHRRSSSFHDEKWPVLQLCGRREHMMTNVHICILTAEALVPI